ADDAGLQNRGWEENGFVRMVNPLVHHYYLAMLMKLWEKAGPTGTTAPDMPDSSSLPHRPPEWFLRLGCVLLSCGASFFLYELARRWTYHPFLSTVLMILTPAFWLSSYSLLIDPTMMFFAMAGLYCLVRSVELDSMALSWGTGVLWGLAILTKYPALFVLPLG